ncbi:MAG TPA: sodium-dependent transporter [Candidatus Polarisedimenticolaceae bacterium]|nr:sodium-dependent transporter [Candidatus Polarisedimenticolaceae bacterium]
MTAPVRFASRLTTILTMVGVAVGLGNVWRFPYMMGSYGGSAFLFVYLAFVLLLGIPAVIGEWALGRETRRGTLGALDAAFGRAGRPLGWILVGALAVANSYYLVVIGNVVYTMLFSVAVGFRDETLAAYRSGLTGAAIQASITLAALASALAVLALGFNRGAERLSRWFVPISGGMLIYLIAHSLALPGAIGALARFLRPDFAALTPTHVFAAMGQAFYSLSLGGTMLVVYGSYLREQENIRTAAIATALGDAGTALLAALFLVPTTLVLGLELTAGPQLVFDTLPRLFALVSGGRVAGTLFLAALAMVAYLSTLAALEVLLGALRDTLGLSTRTALSVLGATQAGMLLPSVLWPRIIGTLDLVVGSGMQLAGSGVALIALGWGLGRATLLTQVFGAADASGFWPQSYLLWVRWVVPFALAVTLALYLYDSLF